MPISRSLPMVACALAMTPLLWAGTLLGQESASAATAASGSAALPPLPAPAAEPTPVQSAAAAPASVPPPPPSAYAYPPPSAPVPPPPDPSNALPAAGTLMGLGMTVGAMHYGEDAGILSGLDFGSGDYVDSTAPFLTRGGWLGVEGEYLLFPRIAVAARGRLGWLKRGPATHSHYAPTPGQDLSSLDPQLGDSPVGGSGALMVRFFPGIVALDLGGTISGGSFRPRGNGSLLQTACTDPNCGQTTFSASTFFPTVRVSTTGTGLFAAAGIGEGFVRTHEPGVELLIGGRSKDFDLMGGLARGLAIRADIRTTGSWWLSLDCSWKPWAPKGVGDGVALIGAVSLTRRWSDFAPL
jgi:hypothetical protein